MIQRTSTAELRYSTLAWRYSEHAMSSAWEVESVSDWHVLLQNAGTLYIGNLCASWHRARFFDHKQAGVLCAVAGDVQVAVMLRTDVFCEERTREKKMKPKPTKVFDVVNEIAADALATFPPRFLICRHV